MKTARPARCWGHPAGLAPGPASHRSGAWCGAVRAGLRTRRCSSKAAMRRGLRSRPPRDSAVGRKRDVLSEFRKALEVSVRRRGASVPWPAHRPASGWRCSPRTNGLDCGTSGSPHCGTILWLSWRLMSTRPTYDETTVAPGILARRMERHARGRPGRRACRRNQGAWTCRHRNAIWSICGSRPAPGGAVSPRTLLRTVLDRLRDSGVHTVWLWILNGNDPALRLYEQFGFQSTNQRQPLPDDPTATRSGCGCGSPRALQRLT